MNYIKIFIDKLREFKWWIQRIFRGYGDNDLWSMDSFLVKRIRKPLKAFIKYDIKRSYSIPGCLCTGDDDKDRENWDNILRKMELAFDLLAEDEMLIPENLIKEKYKDQVKMFEAMDEGLQLFGKYFNCLWN